MSATQRRRLVLELCHGCADAQTMRTAAQFAASLGLDLHGVFIEDTSVLALAELPFVREIALPTHQWQKLDVERMQDEMRHAARQARRMLHDIGASIGVSNAFEVLRGEPGETIAAVLSAGDVVVISAPANAGARLAPGFARVHEAAHVSAASVLLLPIGFAPRHGAVVAIISDAADASLVPAAQLAVSAKENLLLLLPQDGDDTVRLATEQAATMGMAASHIATRRLTGLQTEDVLHALGHMRESLIVLTHGACPAAGVEEASRIVAERGVPVLLIEPFGATDHAQRLAS